MVRRSWFLVALLFAMLVASCAGIGYLRRPWFTKVVFHEILPIPSYEPDSRSEPPYVLWWDRRRNAMIVAADPADLKDPSGVYGKDKLKESLSFIKAHFRRYLADEGSSVSFVFSTGNKLLIPKHENTMIYVSSSGYVDQANIQPGVAEQLYRIQPLPGAHWEAVPHALRNAKGYVTSSVTDGLNSVLAQSGDRTKDTIGATH
jgi:hypothetical protein